MARHLIAVKYEGKCADCGATLPQGAEARYYGRGIMYGITCHAQRNGHNGSKPNSHKPAKPLTKAQKHEQLEQQGKAAAQALVQAYEDTREELARLEELNARAQWLYESNGGRAAAYHSDYVPEGMQKEAQFDRMKRAGGAGAANRRTKVARQRNEREQLRARADELAGHYDILSEYIRDHPQLIVQETEPELEFA